jgi:stage V sporulation protein G
MAMEITEVRIKLMQDPQERLRAFCSITLDDCFVVRDLKIIEGSSGPFVAMPSRKLTSHCPACGTKNHLRALYCNQCGVRMKEDRAARDDEGRAKLYADIAHPINSACREMIQQKVMQAFAEELEKAKQPGYVSRYEDFDEDVDDLAFESAARRAETPSKPQPRAAEPKPPEPKAAEPKPAESKGTETRPAETKSPEPQPAPSKGAEPKAPQAAEPKPPRPATTSPPEQPRGPHEVPSKQVDIPKRFQPPDSFGAGIFD